MSVELRAVTTPGTGTVEVPELGEVLLPPVVAESAGHVPGGDLLPRLDLHLGPHLQVEVLSLDVVGVADAGTVDEAVHGVEHHARALLQVASLQLHAVGLQDPDTSVNLRLGEVDSPELLHEEGHHVDLHGG